MSVTVRPAGADDIDAVCDLLHDNMSARIGKDRWRNLLDYPWRPADADRGRVAVDGDRVVGFLGLVYADRPMGGRTHRFCNICAWYLLKEYRGRGIGRLIQLDSVADQGVTYTILTATEATGRAFGSSGFQVLDRERYIVRRAPGSGGNLDVVENIPTIETLLDPWERKIMRDHRPYNVRHLLFRSGGESCYLIIQVKRKGEDIDYFEVMHANDRRFLARHAKALANALLDSDRAVFAFDKRFLDEPAPFESETMRLPRWFRSGTVNRSEIDHLYSEIVLLDLKL
jgi:GNAT superfamily N-acetyltransferase